MTTLVKCGCGHQLAFAKREVWRTCPSCKRPVRYDDQPTTSSQLEPEFIRNPHYGRVAHQQEYIRNPAWRPTVVSDLPPRKGKLTSFSDSVVIENLDRFRGLVHQLNAVIKDLKEDGFTAELVETYRDFDPVDGTGEAATRYKFRLTLDKAEGP